MVLAGVGLLLLVVMVRSAWISDDALISFRVIDHFVNGDGLRFNLAERVQAYTHPLWLGLLSPFYALTREAFFTPIFVSLVLSLVAVAGAVWASVREQRWLAATGALLCLISSKAFVDYTSSGLETPLSYALLALWLWVYFDDGRQNRIGWLFCVASLAFLNRMDSVLLLAPGLVVAVAETLRDGVPKRRFVPRVLRASSPALLWIGFSLLYYGVPFPNTFYAKVATGIEPALLREQGLFYLGHAFRFDSTTMLVIALGVGLAIYDAVRHRRPRAAAVGLGIVLHGLYVVQVGGDFMAGRFLALPFFAALILALRVDWPEPAWIGTGLACLAVSLVNPLAPLRSGPDYDNRDQEEVIANRGISDERGFYYKRRGLLSPHRETRITAGWQCRGEPASVVIRDVCGELGHEAFTGCRERFLVDRCALSDALLARMPMIDPNNWRVGHYFRRVPRGYRQSLEQGSNDLVDPSHRALYEDIRRATRDPLFAPGRGGAIWRLSTRSWEPLGSPAAPGR
jgi:arabinofuranosyltransferase